MKKSPLVIVAVVALAVVIYSQRGDIAMRLLGALAPRIAAADMTRDLPDGLHVALCGAGSPLADPIRSGPCVLVLAGKQLFVVDSGTGGARNIGTMRYPVGKVAGVFLTHFHSDHIDGLGELATLRWVSLANTQPLPVFGPDGVEDIVDGFNRAYARDSVYRNDHHGDAVAPLAGRGLTANSFPVPQGDKGVTVLEKEGVKVTAFSVDHAPITPAVGYRFDYRGRSAVISGDTDQSDTVEKFAKNVDLLVHEALAPQLVNIMNKVASDAGNQIGAQITHDILDYHASPVEAAATARDAGVGHLLFYHIVPGLILPGLESVWLEGVDDVFDNYTLGQDGTAFSLPADSSEITQIATGL